MDKLTVFSSGREVRHVHPKVYDREVVAGVARMLELAEPPTALFAGTDSRALPAMNALEARGRRVGEAFAVVGFGDSAFRSGLCATLTSVRIHTRQMGEAAVRAALAAPRSPQAHSVIVPDRLMVRGTVCRRAEGERKSV